MQHPLILALIRQKLHTRGLAFHNVLWDCRRLSVVGPQKFEVTVVPVPSTPLAKSRQTSICAAVPPTSHADLSCGLDFHLGRFIHFATAGPFRCLQVAPTMLGPSSQRDLMCKGSHLWDLSAVRVHVSPCSHSRSRRLQRISPSLSPVRRDCLELQLFWHIDSDY